MSLCMFLFAFKKPGTYLQKIVTFNAQLGNKGSKLLY